MGFDLAMYHMPAINGYTVDDMFDIERYFSYENNELAKKTYDSALSYANAERASKNDQRLLTEEDIQTVQDYTYRNQKDDIRVFLDSWSYGSCSRDLYDWMCKTFSCDYGKPVVLKLYQVWILLEHCWEEYSSQFSTEFRISKAFNYSEDLDCDRSNTLVLRDIDGIEMTNMDGLIVRRDFAFNDDPTLMLGRNGAIDMDHLDMWKSLIDTLIDTLENWDDDYQIVFVGSY